MCSVSIMFSRVAQLRGSSRWMQQRCLSAPNWRSPGGSQRAAHGFFYLWTGQSPEILHPQLPRGGLDLCLLVGTWFHQWCRFFPSTSRAIQTTGEKGNSPPSQTSETQVIQFNIWETITNWGIRKTGFIYFLLPSELNKKGGFSLFSLWRDYYTIYVLTGCFSDSSGVDLLNNWWVGCRWKILRVQGYYANMGSYCPTLDGDGQSVDLNWLSASVSMPLGNCLV